VSVKQISQEREKELENKPVKHDVARGLLLYLDTALVHACEGCWLLAIQSLLSR